MAAPIRLKAFDSDLAVGDSNLQLTNVGNIKHVPPCTIIMVERDDDRVQRPRVIPTEGMHYQYLISLFRKNMDDAYI